MTSAHFSFNQGSFVLITDSAVMANTHITKSAWASERNAISMQRSSFLIRSTSQTYSSCLPGVLNMGVRHANIPRCTSSEAESSHLSGRCSSLVWIELQLRWKSQPGRRVPLSISCAISQVERWRSRKRRINLLSSISGIISRVKLKPDVGSVSGYSGFQIDDGSRGHNVFLPKPIANVRATL